MKKKKFDCYIISETSLGLQCAEHILSAGCHVLGIVSPDYKTYQWAIKHNIRYFSSIEEFHFFGIESKSFDYLFSIVNYSVISKDLLDFPRCCAINYHDSILPKYAGVHATSWAILNQETFHGISWHMVNDKIDSGSILKQCIFEIDEDETAFSLNLKCYTYAAKLFLDLVHDIASDNITYLPQDLTQRSYFSMHQKPDFFGFIDWNKSAEEIHREHRALSFGKYQNMFSSSKILIGKSFYVPDSIKILSENSSCYPGTVIEIDNHSFQISTKTKNISINGIKSYSGEKVNIKELLEESKILTGFQLPKPSAELIVFLEQNNKEISKAEKFWRKNLAAVVPAQLPFVNIIKRSDSFISFPIQSIIYQKKNINFVYTLVTAFVVYLNYMSSSYPFEIGFITSFLKNLTRSISSIFPEYLPIKFSIPKGMKSIDVVNHIQNVIKNIEDKKTYLKDIFIRYPEIKQNNCSLPIVFSMGDHNHINLSLNNTFFLFNIDEKSKSYKIHVKSQTCEAVEDLFNDCSIHINNIFQQIISFPNESIDSINVLTDDESHKIIHSWNGKVREYNESKTIYQIFEDRVDDIPDKIAVIYKGQHLTYQQLNERVNKLAYYLFKRNYLPEAFIAVLLDRSIDLLVSILAISKVGYVYIPLDPAAPEDRNKYILNDSNPSILITSKKLSLIAECEVLYMEELDILSNKIHKFLNPIIYPMNVSYIIYTSGSTGNPKGVMVHHSGMMNHMYCKIEDLALLSSDIIAQTATQVFDISIWQFLTSIVIGSRVVIFEDDEVKEPSKLLKTLVNEKITILELVPSHTLALLDVINNAKVQWCLKYLLITGEALPSELCNRLLQLDQNLKIVNAYGPTECSDDVTHYKIDKYLNCSLTAPIGAVLNNLECYVLNKNLFPVPQGVIGELYIGGVGLARGYLNRADLTAERFVANPYQLGSRLYKTGDLVKWLSNGILEYLGRNDFQVKVRGYRIELEEIENALNKFNGIKQSVVIASKNNEIGKNKHLIGYYLADRQLDEMEILKYLREFLPDYMIPNALMHIDKLPLTLNGKLDRNALPDPSLIINYQYAEPRNELEKKVCSILAEILALPKEKVGIQSDFFKLGGDSIISIQFVSRLRQRLGLNLTVKEVFANGNVERIFNNVFNKSNIRTLVIKTEQGILEGEAKLLPIQRWFFNNNYTISQHWNQSFIIKVPELNIQKLQTSINKLSIYHDAFRFRYRNIGAKIHQYYNVSDTLNSELKILDIADIPFKEGSDKFKIELNKILTSWQSGFDLENGPIYCVGYVYGYSDRTSRIYFSAHHLIIDSVSWRILLEDLQELYNEKELGSKNSSYRQWSEVIESYGVKNIHEKNFWKDVISDYDNGEILRNLVLGKNIKNQASLGLSKITTKLLLEKVNETYNTNINDILLTAFSYVLFDITGCKANHITLEGHGREEIDSEIDVTRTLGWFTTLYPVRLEVQDSFAKSLKNIKESLRKIPNKGIGYGTLIGYEEAELPKILFNYFGKFDEDERSIYSWKIVDEDAGNWSDPSNIEKSILILNCIITNDGFKLSVTSKFDAEVTNKVANLFKLYLEDIVRYCCDQKRTYLTTSDIGNIISQEYLDSLQQEKEIEGVYLANSLQQGFIYHFLNQGSFDDSYKVQNIWNYNAFMNVEKLRTAWIYAQKKYTCLRLRFSWKAELVQVVDKESSIDFRYFDISSQNNKKQAIDDIQKKDRLENYNLEKSGLFRIYLIKQEENLYTCLLSDHHAIIDGWSIPVLLDYVHRTYLKLLNTNNIQVTEDKSYNNAQKYMQEHREDNLDYWKQYLSNIEVNVDLNNLTNQSIKNLNEYNYIKHHKEEEFIIQSDLYNGLKRITRENGVTLNAILQFAWQKVLSICTNSDQTISGIVVSGRNIPIDDVESSVGLYINTLPLVVNHKDNRDKSIIDLIRNLQSEINEISSRSNINLVLLQKESKRLFNNLFVYENYPIPNNAEYEKNIGMKFMCSVERIDYPLGVVVQEENNRITFKLKYAGEIFNTDVILELLNLTEVWLRLIADHYLKDIRSLNYLNDEQYNKIIKKWNDKTIEYPDNITIFRMFEKQVKETPNRIALVYENLELTYEELNNQSNRLANYLINIKKIDPEQKVAICLSSSEKILISILAVLKSGGVYVPIDPSYPDEKIRYILTDSKASCLLISKKLKDRLLNISKEVIVLDDQNIKEMLLSQSKNNPFIFVESSNLAYIIYTSGTTGAPKGVMIEHKSVINLAITQGKEFGLVAKQDTKNCLWYSNYVFDAHVSEVYTAILNGHTIHVLSNGTKHNTKLLELYIKNRLINIATIPPVILTNLNLFSLDIIVVAGDKTDKKLLDAYKGNNINVINAYGPTETTVCASLNHYINNGANNIGYPISNIKCYILDQYLNPVPVGIIGELYIGGDGIARGYLNQPDLTAEKFIANPFSDQCGLRIYKTGDLVRWLQEGNIEYICRNDSQVKIRGNRVELGEIESALLSYSGIKQCIVLEKQIRDRKYLVGYYTTNYQLNEDNITNHLNKILPEYMMPSVFIHLENLPININGKINKKLLPEPKFSFKKHVSPRNSIEKKLCQIWERALNLSDNEVGIEDDFFKLGGDSIIAIKLVTSIFNELNLNLKISSIFQYKTIGNLVDSVEFHSENNLEGKKYDF